MRHKGKACEIAGEKEVFGTTDNDHDIIKNFLNYF
jgi:hypothetical protein